MLFKPALRKMATLGLAFTAITALLLAGCGGGGSSSTPTPTASTLGGVAAVGYPLVGAAVQVVCAGGSTLNTTTSSTGTWQVTFSGQTAPCAAQVSGGTINGAANTTNYHSISTTTGALNASPLTDLVVANLVGTSTPSTWFAGLVANPAPLSAITQAAVNASVANLAAALPQLPLGANNPLTMTFSATPGTVGDDMLAALQTAMTNSATTYATLLTDASAPGFTAPAASFGTALNTAYLGTASGGSVTPPATPSGVSASASSTSQISISWTNVSGATSYNVYRSTSSNVQIIAGNKITSGTSTTSTPYGDSGLAASTPYYYKVTAVNAAGESGGSSEVSATTQAPAAPAPTITSFTPSSGAVGTAVTITGTNFSTTAANNAVSFNGTTATVSSATATSISVTVPAGATSGTISVTTSGGTATSAASFTVTAPPVVVGSQMGGARQGVALNLTGTTTSPIATTLYYPNGIATDGIYLFVADTIMGAVRKVNIATGAVTTVATGFSRPYGITTTDGITLYVANNYGHTIVKVDVATGAVTPFVGTANTSGSTDGVGAAARFYYPQGITTDGTNIFVADYFNHTIRKIDIATATVSTLAGLAGSLGGGDGVGSAARFHLPYDVTTDGTSVFVSDSGRGTVRKIDIASQTVTTLAGLAGSFGSTDGVGSAARLGTPTGITCDGSNLFVTDYYYNNIRQVNIASGTVTTVAGVANISAATVDGNATTTRFNGPAAATTDGVSLYVVDQLGGTIRKIQ
ncbi:MAG: IPT/TIG domain-containing protein [Sideroxydans sp.]|nr:IPT/TIG domain-containing protein [Sideroxydans sp.]